MIIKEILFRRKISTLQP